jgi:hypothetical protein
MFKPSEKLNELYLEILSKQSSSVQIISNQMIIESSESLDDKSISSSTNSNISIPQNLFYD